MFYQTNKLYTDYRAITPANKSLVFQKAVFIFNYKKAHLVSIETNVLTYIHLIPHNPQKPPKESSFISSTKKKNSTCLVGRAVSSVGKTCGPTPQYIVICT